MKHESDSLPARRRQTLRAVEHELSCIELVRCCTNLIDEVQRERGLSQLVLSTLGESYAAALREQILISGEVEQSLRAQIERLDPIGSGSASALARLVQQAQGLLRSPGLADLQGMRRRVLLTRCSRQEMFDAYCTLIAQLLNLVETAHAALRERELECRLATLLHLMHGKEYSGQERARGAGLFVSGRHDVRDWQQIRGLIEAQQYCASRFVSQAHPDARRLLKDTLQLDTQAEVERLRQLLSEMPDQAPLDAGMGELWFRSCSRRMNELREVERQLLQGMRESLQQRLSELAQAEPARQGRTRSAAWLRGGATQERYAAR